MDDIHSSPVSTFTVGKARKKNGFYMCPIYSNKKNPFYVHFDGALVIGIKDVGNTMILKCKSALSYMDELTSVLLKIVELNHTEWFNSSIDESFIEEYFTTPIHYDNRNGVVLRLKLKNIEDIEHIHLNQKTNITLILKNITFLRQKFYPVFEVHSVSPIEQANDFHVDDIEEDAEDDDDDDVVPSFEEVLAIRNETLLQLQRHTSILQKEIDTSTTRLRNLLSYKSKLENCKLIDEILKCCEEIREVC
jgi:hypothetical protein